MSETLEPKTLSSACTPAEQHALTGQVTLERVIMLVNPMAGSVGPRAAAEAEAILAQYACESSVVELNGADFDAKFWRRLTPGLMCCSSLPAMALRERSRRGRARMDRLSRHCQAAR